MLGKKFLFTEQEQNLTKLQNELQKRIIFARVNINIFLTKDDTVKENVR